MNTHALSDISKRCMIGCACGSTVSMLDSNWDLEVEERRGAAAASGDRVACRRQVLALALEASLPRRPTLELEAAPSPQPIAKLVDKTLRVHGR